MCSLHRKLGGCKRHRSYAGYGRYSRSDHDQPDGTWGAVARPTSTPMGGGSLPLASLRVSTIGSRLLWVRTWADKSASIRSSRSCNRYQLQQGDRSNSAGEGRLGANPVQTEPGGQRMAERVYVQRCDNL